MSKHLRLVPAALDLSDAAGLDVTEYVAVAT